MGKEKSGKGKRTFFIWNDVMLYLYDIIESFMISIAVLRCFQVLQTQLGGPIKVLHAVGLEGLPEENNNRKLMITVAHIY